MPPLHLRQAARSRQIGLGKAKGVGAGRWHTLMEAQTHEETGSVGTWQPLSFRKIMGSKSTNSGTGLGAGAGTQ